MHDNLTPIDAVITWVDGNDERHQRKRLKVLENKTGAAPGELATGQDPTRFLDNGELYYCIRSIYKFAPWIRDIHLVTDNQVPAFLTPELQQHYRVRIVDHRDIFESYEWALPVFNNRSIETVLWRIPDLAPRFIYFNDDFLLTRTVTPEHFFREDRVVLRGFWNRLIRYGPIRMKLNDWGTLTSKNLLGITRSMNLLLQMRSARMAGFRERYFRIPHVPQPLKTETLKSWFDGRSGLFEENISYKFRSTDQFSPFYLAHHLEIKNELADLEDARDLVMINGEMDFGFTLRRKLHRLSSGQTTFGCLHAMERFKKRRRDHIHATLEDILGPE